MLSLMQQFRQNDVFTCGGKEVSRRGGDGGFNLFVQQDVRAESKESSEKQKQGTQRNKFQIPEVCLHEGLHKEHFSCCIDSGDLNGETQSRSDLLCHSEK